MLFYSRHARTVLKVWSARAHWLTPSSRRKQACSENSTLLMLQFPCNSCFVAFLHDSRDYDDCASVYSFTPGPLKVKALMKNAFVWPGTVRPLQHESTTHMEHGPVCRRAGSPKGGGGAPSKLSGQARGLGEGEGDQILTCLFQTPLGQRPRQICSDVETLLRSAASRVLASLTARKKQSQTTAFLQ